MAPSLKYSTFALTAIAALSYIAWSTQPTPSLSTQPLPNVYLENPAELVAKPDSQIIQAPDSADSEMHEEPAQQPEPIAQERLELQSGSANLAGIKYWEVGHAAPSDEEFYRLAALLRNDPEFFAQIAQEFQSETDPVRLERLAFLLGEAGGTALTDIASQMVFSGNIESEKAALSLLSRTQEKDPAARDLILQVMSSRHDQSVLIAALNAMAQETTDISDDEKQNIANHISPLTQHSDPSVRRHSYTMLFRWASDLDHLRPQLMAGLRDPDPRVRRSTAFGFMDYPQMDQVTKLELFSMLNNSDETTRNRKVAASTLRKFPLATDELSHINATLDALR